MSSLAASEAPSGESPFEPVAESLRYPPPRAGVDADPSKPWLRRLFPVVLAHPGVLGFSVAASILSMLTSVAAPAVLLYRVMTLWLPVLPGWIAFNQLTRKGEL